MKPLTVSSDYCNFGDAVHCAGNIGRSVVRVPYDLRYEQRIVLYDGVDGKSVILKKL